MNKQTNTQQAQKLTKTINKKTKTQHKNNN